MNNQQKKTHALLKIRKLVEEDQLNEAKRLVGVYEKIFLEDIDTISIKFMISLKEGKLDEAERYYVTHSSQLNVDEELLYDYAIIYYTHKKYEFALSICGTVLDKFPNSSILTKLYELIADILGSAKEYVG